jgi:hypothetical protein
MRRLVAVIAFVAGCDFMFDLDRLKTPVDAGPDGEAVPMDAPGCFGKYAPSATGLVQICLDEAPPDTWTPTGELNTSAASSECHRIVAQSGTPSELCVIIARNITLDAFLPTRGNRPVVFVATDTFTLSTSGGIGVDSRRTASRNGAGSNEPSCSPAPNGMGSTSGSSGGGGGSFGARGGNGGSGTGGTAGAISNLAITALGPIRGGCRGGLGGGATANGASGGAVYIIAGKQVVIEGLIDASGEAGAGGTTSSVQVQGNGGGGGGSGGLIAIDSSSIRITASARLVANGGGGGGGGDGMGGFNGAPGFEAQLDMPPLFPAPGGGGGDSSGNGGRGGGAMTGANNGAPAQAAILNSAGGGGGGGAGIIRFYSSAPVDIQTANISPMPSQ